MRTVVLGPPPPELAALIARRRQLGLDKYDEVWDGEYHMAPMADFSHGFVQSQIAALLGPLAEAAAVVSTGPFNLGSPNDFRVPDWGLLRDAPMVLWVPTAAVVVEIESPDDETWEKLPFYASRGVEEVLIVSAQRRSVTWLIMEGNEYVRYPASRLLGPKSAALESRIEWPQFPPVDEGN
jgi:hypothetical protein